MGYMSLCKGNWSSDRGGDLRSTIQERKPDKLELNQIVAETLKDKGNKFNPSGEIHIALLIEDKVISKKSLNQHNLIKLRDYLRIHVDLAKDKTLWSEEDNRLVHLSWYERLYKAVR